MGKSIDYRQRWERLQKEIIDLLVKDKEEGLVLKEIIDKIEKEEKGPEVFD